MDPQEIKERYQQLLEEYHSKKIDWKTFETRLLELKLMRSQLASNPDGSNPITERFFFSPPPPSSSTGNHTAGTGRFQIDSFPGEKVSPTRSFRQIGGNGMPLTPDDNTAKSSVFSNASTGTHGQSSQIFRATGPIQTPRRGQRLNVGVKLGNDYRLQRFLGIGQCGETWLAEEINTGNFVVLKPLPLHIQNADDAMLEFQRIFRRVSALRYPGICPLFRLAKDEIIGNFMVSAYVDAISLDDYYDEYRKACHDFPISTIVRLLWPLAKALDYAHRRGIVHRCLSPHNILIGRHSGVVVTDFWIPTTIREKLQQLGVSSDAEDGASWRAPEVWMDSKFSPRSDQYSLGVLAYQLLFGHRPFRGRNQEELREAILFGELPHLAKLPGKLADTMQKVLANAPESRFTSCLDFVAQLDNQDSQGPHFEKLSEKEQSAKPRRGLWTVMFGAAALREPEVVVKATLEDLWPFESVETLLESRSEARQTEATFPYKNPPKGFSSLKHFGRWSLLLGGALAATVLGGAIFLVVPGLTNKPGEVQKNKRAYAENVATTGQPPINQPATDVEHSPELPQVHPPSIHKILEDNAATVDPADVDRLNTLATGGDVEAQRRLGEAYFYGKGLSRDRKRAIEYFQLGAEQEDVSSLYHLARCYELGIGGIHKSMVRAVELYKKASDGGSEAAVEALKRLNVRD